MKSFIPLVLSASVVATPSAEVDILSQQTQESPTASQECAVDEHGDVTCYVDDAATYSLQQELEELFTQTFTPSYPELEIDILDEQATQSAEITGDEEFVTLIGPKANPNQASESAVVSLPDYSYLQSSTGPGLDENVLFSMVNQYRQDNGLHAYANDQITCEIATERLPELHAEIAGPVPMHAGLAGKKRGLRILENLIKYRTEVGAFNWWRSSSIHNSQMLSELPHACIKCTGQACVLIIR